MILELIEELKKIENVEINKKYTQPFIWYVGFEIIVGKNEIRLIITPSGFYNHTSDKYNIYIEKIKEVKKVIEKYFPNIKLRDAKETCLDFIIPNK